MQREKIAELGTGALIVLGISALDELAHRVTPSKQVPCKYCGAPVFYGVTTVNDAPIYLEEVAEGGYYDLVGKLAIRVRKGRYMIHQCPNRPKKDAKTREK